MRIGPLSLVLGGEGWGEGRSVRGVISRTDFNRRAEGTPGNPGKPNRSPTRDPSEYLGMTACACKRMKTGRRSAPSPRPSPASTRERESVRRRDEIVDQLLILKTPHPHVSILRAGGE